MNCIEVRNDDTMERYLRGELSEGDSQQFEEHYFSCDDCYESLRDISAVQSELAKDRWAVREARTSSGWPGAWTWAWAAALILLAVGLTFWLRAHEPLGLSEDVLAELAAIEPPPFEPLSLRGPSEVEENPFEEAMIPYQEGDYLAAAESLELVVQSQPRDATALFYLGASYLLMDRQEEAIGSLGRVVDLGESRYLSWARLYRAKAHLGLGDVAAARSDLEAVVTGGGELAAQAKDILGQL